MQQPNPFSVATVDSPRRVGPIVESLNGEALDRIVTIIDQTLVPAPHRPNRAPKIVHIQSSRAGLGKSHLLGRIFKTLDKKATRIYLLPFQNSKTAWASILDTIIEELRRPEENRENDELHFPDQLDAFAHGIFGHALAELIKNGEAKVEGMEDSISTLQSGICSKWDLTDNELPLTQAFHSKFAEMQIYLEERIDNFQRNQPVPISNLTSLLKVIYTYASSRKNFRQRKLCYNWLKCIPYEDAESYEPIGLKPFDLVNPNMDSADQESECKKRVVDIAILSSFYRPFLFCFDQIEYYVESEQLVRRFCQTLDYFYRYVPNHTTVFTSNLGIWQRVTPLIEEAYKDSIDNTPVELIGLNEAQGIELIHLRMEGYSLASKKHLLELSWLSPHFSSGPIGSRDFLKLCEERYSEIEGSGPVQPSQEKTISELFDRKVKEVSRNRQLIFTYDLDLMQWVSECVLPTGHHNLAAAQFESRRDYYPLSWTIGGETIVHGFEAGNHHGRWGGRLDESDRLSKTGVKAAIHLRTPECAKIPRPGWKRAQDYRERSDSFFVIHLTFDELALIHATYQLNLDACDNTISFSSEQVITYASSRLSDIRERVLSLVGGASPGPEPDPLLNQRISEIVRETLFIALPQLANRLTEFYSMDESEQHILNCCHQLENVEVHTAGAQVVLHYFE